MKILKHKTWYNKSFRRLYETNSRSLYLFGDNKKDRNTGYVPYKTQAVIRGIKNSYGISTKNDRYTNPESFMSYKEYQQSLKEELKELRKLIKTGIYDVLLIPEDGIGTGEAIKNNPKLTQKEKAKFKDLAYKELVKLINSLK